MEQLQWRKIKKLGSYNQVKNPLLKFIPDLEGDVDLIVEDVFHLPSPHMTPSEMLQLQVIIDERVKQDNIHGVVITHGTDTLEETAYFLDLTVQATIPIVVTGAMRSSNELGADGLYNFLSAVKVASCDEVAEKGVLVVLNDEIHCATNVTKHIQVMSQHSKVHNTDQLEW